MIRQVRTRRVRIGPAEAAAWLTTSSRARQRPIDASTVSRLVEQIRSGRWRSSSIVVGREGLLDGQHRMLAVVQTGAMVDMTLFAVSDVRMRCIQCPEACHVGGQRSRTKPRMIAVRSFPRRSRGRKW